jgi:tRNA pseudouridine55 synthase
MATPAETQPLNGWLVLDKPEGPSSAQLVARVRRLSGVKRIGHGGTLDPLASGVLPLALGEATKTAGYALGGDKKYRFTIRFGEARDSDDRSGRLVGVSAARPSEAAIRALLPAFEGIILQTPPVFSAIKVQGRRAYSLARADRAPELAPRPVHIAALRMTRLLTEDEAEFELACGKGTYVRAIARDFSVQLGTLGHVGSLRRLAAGCFTEAQAISLDMVESLVHSAALADRVLPVESVLDDIPAMILTADEAKRLRQGQAIPRDGEQKEGTVRALESSRLVAIARLQGGWLRPVRVFNLE